MSQQVWVTNSLGGYLSNNTLSKKIRHASQAMQRFRQFVDIEPAAGKGKGEKVLFNKISNLASSGGTLSETSTIPKTNYTIQQGSLTVAEWGVAVAHTLKAKVLAEVSVPDIILTALRNDMAKVLDSAAAAQFKTSLYKATILNTATTIFASDGTAGTAAAANMSDKNVRDIIDRMKTLNIPKRSNGMYACVASTNAIRGLYDFFEAKAQATTMDPLMLGEVGKYYGLENEALVDEILEDIFSAEEMIAPLGV